MVKIKRDSSSFDYAFNDFLMDYNLMVKRKKSTFELSFEQVCGIRGLPVQTILCMDYLYELIVVDDSLWLK